MTTSQARGIKQDGLNDSSVADYLQTYPDFFERNSPLLTKLRLPHLRDAGATVSLVERQVEVLREKIQAQDQKLAEFVQVARANNVLAEKIHRFTRRLLRTNGAGPAIAEIEASLREDFNTFHTVLVLASSSLPNDDEPQRFLRRVSADDAAFRSFDSLFAACKPRCGQIRDSQREFLFGAEAPNIGSVALIPLGGPTPAGLLALGSVDRDRFHPGMSTEFLWRMGELITDALARA